MSRKFLTFALAMGLTMAATSAHAVEVLFCDGALTAAAVVSPPGSTSVATGSYQLFVDEAAVTARFVINHNVGTPTSVELRQGPAGANNALLITNFGGATASPINYSLTQPEIQLLFGSNQRAYLVVNDAANPSPGGAIRADNVRCIADQEGEPNEGEPLPEGLGDYGCVVNLTTGQVPGGSTATGAGNLTIEIERIATSEGEGSEIVARLRMTHNVPDATFIYLFQGAPGETGTEIRRISNVSNGSLFSFITLAELEDFSNAPFYFQVNFDPDGPGGAEELPAIRGDIIGCAFDDGVEDPEGEGEGAEGEGEGVVEGEGEGDVDCLLFPEGAPENLQCDVDLTGGAVVSETPNTSPFEGRVQITGPFEPDDFYVMVVRHNVTDVTAINVYSGAVGTNGTLFDIFPSAACPAFRILPSNFLELLTTSPLYVEVESAGGVQNKLRADLLCFGTPEGEGEGGEGQIEGSGDGEGQPTEGEPDGEFGTLRGFAEALLSAWANPEGSADANGNGRLEIGEVTAVIPFLTAQQFQTLNSDGNQGLSTGELHRYAGPIRLHSGDIDGDREVDLSELLGIIQLYNAVNGYTCSNPPGAEDGFEPVTVVKGEEPLPCLPHASDYEGGAPDFSISLTELLRVIQLFNFGEMVYCPGVSEDDYCIAS